jgi:hypothetical protein
MSRSTRGSRLHRALYASIHECRRRRVVRPGWPFGFVGSIVISVLALVSLLRLAAQPRRAVVIEASRSLPSLPLTP